MKLSIWSCLLPSVGSVACLILLARAPGQAAGVCDPFVVSPATASIPGGASGGPPNSFPGSFNVFTEPAGCQWTTTVSAAWVTITSGSGGSQSGPVVYSVAKNPNPFVRTATITAHPILGFGVGNMVHTIYQGGADEVCLFSLNPTSGSFNAGGGTGSFAIDTAHGCSWTVAKNPSVLWLNVTSDATGVGPATVTYSVAPNSSFLSRSATFSIGGQTFTVTQGGRRLPVIRILAFNPRIGPPDTQVVINGEGFGPDPSALSVGVMNGMGFIPMKVLRATDTEIVAQLGAVPPNALPGKIVVTSGKGRVGPFKALYPHLVLRNPAWAWLPDRDTAEAMSQEDFAPTPVNPPPNTRWFFSGPPTNGVLCLYLQGGWFPSNKVTLRLSAYDHGQRVGAAFQVENVAFPGGGSSLDCAAMLCDIIRCGFRQLAGVEMNCQIEQLPAGTPIVKITFSLPSGSIDWGNFDVCVEAATPLPTPVVTDFNPREGSEGTEVEIVGQNFGAQPDNLSVTILNGPLSIPLHVISNSPTQIRARLGPLPPNVGPGPIQVLLGDGNRAVPRFAFDNILLQAPLQTWNQTESPGGLSRQTFLPRPEPTEPPEQCFFSGPSANGEITLLLDSAWPTPARVSIDASLHDTRAGKGREIKVEGVEFTSATIPSAGGGPIVDPFNVLECAYRICEVIGAGSLQGGGFVVSCQVDLVSPGVARITLGMADGFVDTGHLNVCVEPANSPPASRQPLIFDFFPKSGEPGQLITITGRNFGTDPEDLTLEVVNGARTIPLQVIQASDTQIRAVVGSVPPDARPGPLRLSLGEGRFLLPEYFYPDVQTQERAFRWLGAKAVVDSLQDFGPIFKPAHPGERCFYSGPPSGGELILVLPFSPTDPNQWPWPAVVTIDFAAASDCAAAQLKTTVIFSGGGTLLDCAQRICDVLQTAFIGGTNPPIPNCSVSQGTNTVVIRISGIQLVGFFCLQPQLDSGHLNVCVRPRAIFYRPLIREILPLFGREGDVITIRGENFGGRADNLCAVVMDGQHSVPFEVLSASDTEIQAVLGAVAPGSRPGPIMVGLGLGNRGTFVPAFPDVEVRKPVWVWTRTGPATNSAGVFTPQTNPPPAGTTWFFSGPPTNGVLCLYLQGTWPSNASIRIEARAHSHAAGLGHDLRAIDIRLPEGGSLMDCALRICDVVRCAFLQQASVLVECDVEPVGRDVVKLTLRLPPAAIDWGNFNVCVRPAPDARPVITDFTPRLGSMGTLVTIVGNHFIPDPTARPDPHDYCVVHMDRSLATPFEVLSVTTTQIVARVGPVDPTAQPGPIMVGLGRGQRGSFTPVFPDVIPGSDVWTWLKDGADATSVAPFTPRPTEPPPETRWFFSGPPTNGVLCVYLTGNWPQPAIVRVEARAHDHARRIGRDLRAVAVRFEGGGDLFQCAYRICDVIRCAFLQQAGVAVNCTVTPGPAGSGSVKVTLSLPEGQIDWGNLVVCVEPVPTPPPPVITDFTPSEGGEGTVITLHGRNFLGGTAGAIGNPDEFCWIIMSGEMSIPVQVISATDTELRGVLGPVPPNAPPGPMMIGLGRGQRGFFSPAFPDVIQHDPTWTWVRTGPTAESTARFIPIPNNPSPNVVWFFSGPPTNGVLCVYLTGNWTAPTLVRISARAHDHQTGIGRDLSAVSIELPTGGSLLDCAHRICDVIRCAFLQQAGVVVNCHVQLVGAAAPMVKLTLSLPEGRVNWGNFDICVQSQAPPPPSMVITDIQPRIGSNGTVVTITGRGFGNAPDNLSIGVLNGAEVVMLRTLRSTDTEIIAQLGVVPFDAQAGPIALALGSGGPVSLPSAFTGLPQALSADSPWAWSGGNPALVSSVAFQPILSPCGPISSFFFHQTIYSGPPSGGQICVTVDGALAFINKLSLELYAHNDALGLGRDLKIPCHCFGPTGTFGVTKANLICQLITQAFQAKGIIVNCTVTSLANNRARLCISLPEGPITWGSLTVCLQDGEGIGICPCRPFFEPIPWQQLLRFSSSGRNSLRLTWPRTAVGYELQVTDSLGGRYGNENDWWPVMLPVEGTEAGLELDIPIDPAQPQMFFRLFQPPTGFGPLD